jgi:hypothetical protein
MGCLYMLNFSNGKSYIGLTTKKVEKRVDNHRRAALLNNSQLAVHKAWRKYGSPCVKVLVITENYCLPELEIRAIEAYNTLVPNGYNLSYGGDTSPMLNPMVANKVSLANKGQKAAFKGRKHTEESKEKNRAKHLGKKLTEEHRKKIALSGIGRVTSENTKEKISASNAGKPRSIEYRKKIADSLRKEPLKITEQALLDLKSSNNKRLWTTCKHGHELSGDNLRITHEGKYIKRRCLECSRLRTQKSRDKRRGYTLTNN